MRQQKIKVTRSSSTGGVSRKRFTDITNMQRQPYQEEEQEQEQEIICPISPSTRIYIDTLIKENMTLMRLVGERNKMVELGGAEIVKMRTSMQRLQVQNLNLAQSNSFMLAELNISREKIKSLQHEIACKDAMLKAQKQTIPMMQRAFPVRETFNIPLLEEETDTRLSIHSRGVPRSHSMSRCTTFTRAEEKEAAEMKSPMPSGCCMRSRSARYKSQRSYAREYFFELDDPDYLAYQPPDYPAHRKPQASIQSSSVGKLSSRVAERPHSFRNAPITKT